MKLNLFKYVCAIKQGKFLGFLVSSREIKFSAKKFKLFRNISNFKWTLDTSLSPGKVKTFFFI